MTMHARFVRDPYGSRGVRLNRRRLTMARLVGLLTADSLRTRSRAADVVLDPDPGPSVSRAQQSTVSVQGPDPKRREVEPGLLIC